MTLAMLDGSGKIVRGETFDMPLGLLYSLEAFIDIQVSEDGTQKYSSVLDLITRNLMEGLGKEVLHSCPSPELAEKILAVKTAQADLDVAVASTYSKAG